MDHHSRPHIRARARATYHRAKSCERGWRSTGTGACTIAYSLDTIDDAHLGPLIGIYLDRHNLDDVTIQTASAYSSPTWTTRFSGRPSLGGQAFSSALAARFYQGAPVRQMRRRSTCCAESWQAPVHFSRSQQIQGDHQKHRGSRTEWRHCRAMACDRAGKRRRYRASIRRS